MIGGVPYETVSSGIVPGHGYFCQVLEQKTEHIVTSDGQTSDCLQNPTSHYHLQRPALLNYE